MVRRALKVLSDREVSPQLGLLKSTLLQLDSTFSERDYGASTFRDFIEKMAAMGYVKLKQVDRSLLVELKDQEVHPPAEEQPSEPAQPVVETQPPAAYHAPAQGPSPSQIEEGVRIIQDVFQNPKINPHWPMYLRNVKQFIKNAAPTFDERKFGFASFLEAVRAAQKAGVLRLERNRQGILRVYPGNLIPQPPRPAPPIITEDVATEQTAPIDESTDESVVLEAEPILEAAPAEEVVDVTAEPVFSDESVEREGLAEDPKPARKKRPTARKKVATKSRASAGKRSRKKSDEEETSS
jgi:hypothetical protein